MISSHPLTTTQHPTTGIHCLTASLGAPWGFKRRVAGASLPSGIDDTACPDDGAQADRAPGMGLRGWLAGGFPTGHSVCNPGGGDLPRKSYAGSCDHSGRARPTSSAGPGRAGAVHCKTDSPPTLRGVAKGCWIACSCSYRRRSNKRDGLIGCTRVGGGCGCDWEEPGARLLGRLQDLTYAVARHAPCPVLSV